MVLGVDFSIKSSAATLKSGDLYTFYSFARTGVIKEDVSLALQAAGVIIFETDEAPKPAKKTSIAIKERTSLEDAQKLIPVIVNCFVLQPIDKFGIEGFSFASTGNRLAQLSGYQWVLRWELMRSIKNENFYVYSPMTIKATAGKGNFKKEQMIQAFIDSQDPLLINTGLHKLLKYHPTLVQTKKGQFLKPIDDICDSYWIVKTLEKLNGQE